MDLTATLDLSKLPMVEPRLTGVVGFDELRVIAATTALAATEVTAPNGPLPMVDPPANQCGGVRPATDHRHDHRTRHHRDDGPERTAANGRPPG
ncbi:hypothetical protein OG417_44495 [Actinoallomurus sp. NBC_01490]|uniref:hypothetical protein n=1 Tax=Actinoallomurus sp. NBC_01490 TaxID=2903557 RepID=UPI002E31FCCD|nr:hypothetical protein [Actinoallomurus sp. NBC_01490]